MKNLWVAVAGCLAAVSPAAADEVILRNGASFSGVVREDGDKVVVEVDFGSVTFRRNEVREIRRTGDPLKDYDEKLKAAGGVRDYYELALWARDKGLTTRANDLYKKVISLDPDHEGARRAMGYEKVEGRWLTGDELMLGKGFVRHGNRWLPRETVEELLRQETALQAEAERRAGAERIAELRQEVELAKIAVEQERLELEQRKAHWTWVSWFALPCGCPKNRPHQHQGEFRRKP
jgi:hypothetical protein